MENANDTPLKPPHKPWYAKHPQVEDHVFAVNPRNDFTCLICGEGRALHALTGFTPGEAAPIPIEEPDL